MKKSEVKMILIILLIGVVLIGGLLIWRNSRNRQDTEGQVGENLGQQEPEETNVEEYVQVLDNGHKLNISEELSKTKTLDGFEFSNMQFKYAPEDGITELLVDVENKSGAPLTDYKVVLIDILDEQGNVLSTFTGDIYPTLEVGQKEQLMASLGGDFSNAYDFTIRNQ